TNDDATSPFAPGGGVVAVERGQLHDLVAVDQKNLAHETSVLRGPVGIQSRDDMRMLTCDAELRNDVRAGRRREGREFGGLGAIIGLDLESPNRAGNSGPGVEADGPTVEEGGEPDSGIRVLRHGQPRLVRQLASPAGPDVEEEHLRRVIPGG